MTTSIATIADFLLARIADDEAVARGVPDFCSGVDASKLITEFDDDYLEPESVVIDPARVLAECAAKRAIVEAASEFGIYDGGGWVMADASLRALASVYADHPDYDPAWS